MIGLYDDLASRLRVAGDAIWPLLLRAILFWEFWEAGVTKFRGENWFGDIPWADWQQGFPWPFSTLPLEVNWLAATWGEIVFSLLLLIGLFTRLAALSLIVITAVATAAVHWPAEWNSLVELWQGYVITPKGAGNFKLPLLFIIMLLPLVFHGGGTISLDRILVSLLSGADPQPGAAAPSGAVVAGLLVLALATVFLEPAWALAALAIAFALTAIGRWLR